MTKPPPTTQPLPHQQQSASKMANSGFEQRFRECLGSEDFEERIETFMKRKALIVLRESEISEGKDNEGFKGGEFSLKAHRFVICSSSQCVQTF
jgi:hypothetical protein